MSKKGSNPPPPAGSVKPPPPSSPPISRGWAGYDGPLNLPEFLCRPLVHGEVCEHASLRRSCEICERDDEIERLRVRDKALMTKQGTFKGTGDPTLDACLLQPDPAFTAFVESMPATYWARYDISAVRLGWHFRGEANAQVNAPLAPKEK